MTLTLVLLAHSQIEVPCSAASLNHGDSFLLDVGSTIYCWNGEEASPFEKNAANLEAERLERSRAGKSQASHNIDVRFWTVLRGSIDDVQSADDSPAALPQPGDIGEGVLYRLSDASSELTVREEARGDLDVRQLDSNDVFICDTASQLLVWIGENASPVETARSMSTATKYLHQKGGNDAFLTTPVAILKESNAHHNPIFRKVFMN